MSDALRRTPERAGAAAAPVGLLARLTIGSRLALGFAAVLGAFVALWTLAAINIEHADHLTAQVSERHERTEALSRAQVAAWALRADDGQYAGTSDAGARKQIAAHAPALRKQFEGAIATYDQSVTGEKTAQETALGKQLGAAFASYMSARQRWFELLDAGNAEEAARVGSGTLAPAAAQMLAALEQLVDVQGKLVEKDEAYYHLELDRSRWFIHLVGVSALLAAGIIVWLLARSITVPLRRAVVAVETVANGDLTRPVQVTSRDEVGQLLAALGTMQGKLRELVAEVVTSARNVADTSGQIAQGNLDLSQRTEEQASTLEQTASSMEQLTATVNQNADHARQAREVAAGASRVAAKGGEVVGEVVSTMTGISESSRRISDIIGVIDGIAFQTNILALNAAVEAARAGEQGRGFAVVAAEVRSLAQRSASAAKEIKALIEESVGKVEAGARLVDGAGVTMQEVVASVKKVSDLIAEIASASQEQSSGIAQVSTAVTQMDQVVQQNASLVEEATAATESMKEQAAALVRTVGRFRIDAASPDAGGRQPVHATFAATAPLPGRGRAATAHEGLAALTTRPSTPARPHA